MGADEYGRPIKLTQHKNGRVTLDLSRSDLATLLVDAAKGAKDDKLRYLHDDLLRLAGEYADYERLWFDNSSGVYLDRDVREQLARPLID